MGFPRFLPIRPYLFRVSPWPPASGSSVFLMTSSFNPLLNLPLSGFPDRGPTLTPSGRLWPNGEFSQGYKRSQGDEPLDMRSLADSWGPERGGQGGTPPLDLVNLPNLNKRTAQRGELGISNYGRHMLRNGVYILKDRFPNHPLTLATLTLPPLQTSDRMALSGSWGSVVHQTLQWVQRELKRKGLPPLVLSCSEIQPSRLETEGGAYLHLHLIWVNPPKRSEGWAVSSERLRAFWDDLLRRLTGLPDLPTANIDLQWARGDVARELSKYLSKGSSVLSKAADDLGAGNLPRTWWNMSKALRDLVKGAILSGHAVGQLLLEWIEFDRGQGEDGLFLWLRDIYAEISDRRVQLGTTGQLTRELNRDAHELLVSS